MSDHLNRKQEIFNGVLPPEGTSGYKKAAADHGKMMAANPHLKKVYKDSYEKAIKTA